MTWSEIGSDPKLPATLLVGSYIPEGQGKERPCKRRKIAAFDLVCIWPLAYPSLGVKIPLCWPHPRLTRSEDSTLIATASGKKHGDAATDWRWWNSSVPVRLRQLYNDEG
jgi:bifunctional polynucleotide phosphatase/kinase